MNQTPTTNTETKTLLSALAATVSGVWATFDPLVQALIVLLGLDILSGILFAIATGTLSSSKSFRGMAKRAMMLVLVGAAQTYNATRPLGFDAPTAVAGFFCVTVFISILETAGRIGVPIGPLTDVLQKLKREEK